jgi:F-box-like
MDHNQGIYDQKTRKYHLIFCLTGKPSHNARDSPNMESRLPQSTKPADPVSIVDRIPVELLLAIFHFFRPDITTLISITHTCRRWRLITTESAFLWTDVTLRIRSNSRSVSLLEMQLERTGDLLLDVAWWGHIWEYCNSRVLAIVREKAQFSRWRTLKLGLVGHRHQKTPFFALPTSSQISSHL